jgi:hypothetical protein
MAHGVSNLILLKRVFFYKFSDVTHAQIAAILSIFLHRNYVFHVYTYY